MVHLAELVEEALPFGHVRISPKTLVASTVAPRSMYSFNAAQRISGVDVDVDAVGTSARRSWLGGWRLWQVESLQSFEGAAQVGVDSLLGDLWIRQTHRGSQLEVF